jgi:hypothetical protein
VADRVEPRTTDEMRIAVLEIESQNNWDAFVLARDSLSDARARVAVLETALREAMGLHEYMTDAGITGIEWAVKHKYDPVWGRIRAALAPCVGQTPDHDDELPVKEE